MNYKKILCDFQNFIKEYLSLEHKQHKILDLNLSEVHLLKIAEQNPNYTLIEPKWIYDRLSILIHERFIQDEQISLHSILICLDHISFHVSAKTERHLISVAVRTAMPTTGNWIPCMIAPFDTALIHSRSSFLRIQGLFLLPISLLRSQSSVHTRYSISVESSAPHSTHDCI